MDNSGKEVLEVEQKSGANKGRRAKR